MDHIRWTNHDLPPVHSDRELWIPPYWHPVPHLSDDGRYSIIVLVAPKRPPPR